MNRQSAPVRLHRSHRYRTPEGRFVQEPRDVSSVAPTSAVPETRGAEVECSGRPEEASVGCEPAVSAIAMPARTPEKATPRWSPACDRPDGAAPRLQTAVRPPGRF